MKGFSANSARTKFAELMDISRREPVAITKHGRPVNILLAVEDYEKLIKLEDDWWLNHDCGVPSVDATEEILESIEELKAGKGVRFNMV